MGSEQSVTLTAIVHKSFSLIYANLAKIGVVAIAASSIWLGMNWQILNDNVGTTEKKFSKQDTVNSVTSKQIVDLQKSYIEQATTLRSFGKTQDLQGETLEEIRKTQLEIYKMLSKKDYR